MGRLTRAKAAALSESIHMDEDVPSPQHYNAHDRLETIDEDERTPLGEIASNCAGTNAGAVVHALEAGRSRAKKGASRKGAKCSRQHETNHDLSPDASMPAPIIIPDDDDLPPSPASESAAEDLMKDVPDLDMSNMPTHDIKQASPPSDAVRLTRNQLRTTSVNPSSGGTETVNPCDQPAITASSIDETLEPTECDFDEPTELLEPLSDSTTSPPLDQRATDLQPEGTLASNNSPTTERHTGDALSIITAFEASEEIMNRMSGEPMTPYDELEAAAVEAQTPPRSSRSSSATTAPTSVSDAASENNDGLNGDFPDSPFKTRSQKPTPIVRTTKASQARITLAHGPKDRVQAPSLGRPTTSNRIASNSSTQSNDSNGSVEKKEVVIPHSKPRPMSMAFPAPPPPPKSSKAPTQSNFQLPGEAIAAKLKAAKDARLQKDAEDQKKKAFKARPIPASVAKGAAVRQTNASRARETLMNGTKPAVPAAAVAAPAPTPTRSTTTSRSTSSQRPPHVRAPSALSGSRPPPPISRPSTSMALNSTQPPSVRSRTPSAASSSHPAATLARPASTAATSRPYSSSSSSTGTANGTAKGKQVWHRTAFALEAAERERKEKEEAARKARAEAAERGRAASREWAEKQRVRNMVARMEAGTAGA